MKIRIIKTSQQSQKEKREQKLAYMCPECDGECNPFDKIDEVHVCMRCGCEWQIDTTDKCDDVKTTQYMKIRNLIYSFCGVLNINGVVRDELLKNISFIMEVK